MWALILLAVMPLGVHPAAPGAEASHFDWLGLLGRIFNSTVLFGTLIYILRKPLIRMLTQQSLDIKSDIERRETDLRQNAADLEAISARLAAVEDEIRQMLQSTEENGRAEMARLSEAGESEARRIQELTEAEIEQRLAKAMTQLRGRIADLVVEHFKHDASTFLTPEAQRRIIERNIDQAGKIDAGK